MSPVSGNEASQAQCEQSKIYGPWNPALILTAIGFLTRFPMPAWVGFSQQDVAYASRWFSLVGLMIGLILALGLWLLSPVLGQPIAAALILISGWRLTGGFHEDGLADICDGFGGAWELSRKLEIMKDSQIGTYGVLALIAAFSLKWLALTELPLSIACLGLVISHAAGRAWAGWVPKFLSYARTDGPSKTPQRQTTPSASALCTLAIFGCVPLLVLSFGASLWLCVGWMITFIFMLRLMTQHLQGYTGDTLGATEQVLEIATLLVIVILNNLELL